MAECIDPHINFNGNAEEAFIFTNQFWWKFIWIMRYKDLKPRITIPESE